jgi:endo-1,4-beta-mannosidase
VGPDRGAFRLGVNYWPADAAMGWLATYDPRRTRVDFQRIAAAGFDSIRVFVRWEDAQPAEQRVDAAALRRLVDAADAAADAGVALIVTLFTGHMSGVNWIPTWALGGSGGDPRFRVVSGGHVLPSRTPIRNWYSDPDVVAAQERLAAAAARALSGHPAVWAWDVGNENSNCTVPPDPVSAVDWLQRITAAIRHGDPGRPLTAGIHMEDLEDDRGIGPVEVAACCDFVSMHGYPIYAEWSAGPADDRVVPFLEAMTRWLAGDAPVFFEEFGLPTVPVAGQVSPMAVDAGLASDYIGSVLDRLWADGALGAALWCYSDYATSLFETAPFDRSLHERTFGLWRANGSPKPAVTAIRQRSGRRRRPPSGLGWIDITPEEFSADRRVQLARLYRRYCDGIAEAGQFGDVPRQMSGDGE